MGTEEEGTELDSAAEAVGVPTIEAQHPTTVIAEAAVGTRNAEGKAVVVVATVSVRHTMVRGR